jgi:hypothetical protein
VDRDEVAKLATVLEDDGLTVVEQPAEPDCGNPSIRIAQALPRP